jgi:galactokinase
MKFSPQAEASAPGRVNLLGEHTDYNDGFVLPAAIPQRTTVQLAASVDGRHHFHSLQKGETITCEVDAEAPGFAAYLVGCIRMLEALGHWVPPLRCRVDSTVPMGAGLSSSAALEVAMLRALRLWLSLDLDDVEIARLAQQAEVHYAGVHCGIMDQMAASLATTDRLLFLDTRTLERRLVDLPAGSAVLVLDSGVPRTLAASNYNTRRTECTEAAHLLGVPTLRDLDDPARVEELPEPLNRRARHVVRENARVLTAAAGVDATSFGALMNQSHASLRDDYEVSVSALDLLVTLLQASAGVYGARLTGAGFGGACVALVQTGEGERIARSVLTEYAQAGYGGRLLVG